MRERLPRPHDEPAINHSALVLWPTASLCPLPPLWAPPQVASALLSILPARLNSQQQHQQHQHQHQQGAHGSGSGSGKAGAAGATGLPAHLASHLARHPHSGLMPHHGLALPPLPAGLVGLAGLGGLGAGGGGGGSMSGGGGGGGPGGGESGAVSELVASMPFELRALEVVLEQVGGGGGLGAGFLVRVHWCDEVWGGSCSQTLAPLSLHTCTNLFPSFLFPRPPHPLQTVSLLDAQATELERATRLALDELTLRVNPRNLERMRHLKGRMAALDNKVDTVRRAGGGRAGGEAAVVHDRVWCGLTAPADLLSYPYSFRSDTHVHVVGPRSVWGCE